MHTDTYLNTDIHANTYTHADSHTHTIHTYLDTYTQICI